MKIKQKINPKSLSFFLNWGGSHLDWVISSSSSLTTKNGSKAAFLKRGHRVKKRSYSPIWPIVTFFSL